MDAHLPLGGEGVRGDPWALASPQAQLENLVGCGELFPTVCVGARWLTGCEEAAMPFEVPKLLFELYLSLLFSTLTL